MGFRAKPPLLGDSETYFSQIAFPQGLHRQYWPFCHRIKELSKIRSTNSTANEKQQEKKLIADAKRSAKNGQIGACKIQAKDLARARKSVP